MSYSYPVCCVIGLLILSLTRSNFNQSRRSIKLYSLIFVLFYLFLFRLFEMLESGWLRLNLEFMSSSSAALLSLWLSVVRLKLKFVLEIVFLLFKSKKKLSFVKSLSAFFRLEINSSNVYKCFEFTLLNRQIDCLRTV